jgi:hypothetical protein
MRQSTAVRRFALPCALATLSLSACGDSPAGLEGDPLSEAEIQAVLNALNGTFSSISTSPTQSAPSPASPALAETVVDQSFETSVACPEGGSIGASGSLSGTFDDETLASDLRFDLTFAPDGCVVVAPETIITVGGSIGFVLDMLLDDTQIDMSGSQQGRFSFTTDDARSGSCSIEVSFSTTVDQSTNQVEQSVTGTVCGISASHFQVVTGA